MKFELLHWLLFGAVIAVPVNGLWWLATGNVAPVVVVVAMSMVAGTMLDLTIARWRRRETAMLNERFQRPSFGG